MKSKLILFVGNLPMLQWKRKLLILCYVAKKKKKDKYQYKFIINDIDSINRIVKLKCCI